MKRPALDPAQAEGQLALLLADLFEVADLREFLDRAFQNGVTQELPADGVSRLDAGRAAVRYLKRNDLVDEHLFDLLHRERPDDEDRIELVSDLFEALKDDDLDEDDLDEDEDDDDLDADDLEEDEDE